MTGNEIAVVVIDPAPPRTRTLEPLLRSPPIGLAASSKVDCSSPSASRRSRWRGSLGGRSRSSATRSRPGGATDEERTVEPACDGTAGHRDAPRWSSAPLLNVAFEASRGLMRIAAGLERAIRPLTVVAMIPPVDRAARRLEEMATRRNEDWQAERSESVRAADLFADAVVPQLVDAVIDRLDLTDLVLERVDLRAGSESSSIDLDEIVGRVDVTAIVDGWTSTPSPPASTSRRSWIAWTWSRSPRA